MVAAPRGLGGGGEGRAHHDAVGAGGEALTHVPTGANAAVGDDRDVVAGLGEVGLARGGAVDGRRDLRNADAENLAAGAAGARTHTHEDRGYAGAHHLEGGGEADRVPYHYGDVDVLEELLEAQTLDAAGLVACGRDRALHNKNVRARLLHEGGVLLGAFGRHGDGGDTATLLHLLDADGDEVVREWASGRPTGGW